MLSLFLVSILALGAVTCDAGMLAPPTDLASPCPDGQCQLPARGRTADCTCIDCQCSPCTCGAMRVVRHREVTRLHTTCSNDEARRPLRNATRAVAGFVRRVVTGQGPLLRVWRHARAHRGHCRG